MTDKGYWDERYKTQATRWDVGEVSRPLKTYFDQLQDRSARILIPGAGNAYEAGYLHERGFENVMVCDISEFPLQALKARCPDFPAENLIQADFFSLEIKADLLVEQTFFCAIDPSMRRAYFEKAYQILHPGGRIVGVLFNHEFEEEGPPFGGSADEYGDYFKDLFSTHIFGPCYNSIIPRAGREFFINLIAK